MTAALAVLAVISWGMCFSTLAFAPTQTFAQTTAAPLDINTATPAQLRALPGMGEAYVRRVIAGRPYTAKNQLVTRGILPAAAYELIRDRIIAHRQRPAAPPGYGSNKEN